MGTRESVRLGSFNRPGAEPAAWFDARHARGIAVLRTGDKRGIENDDRRR